MCFALGCGVIRNAVKGRALGAWGRAEGEPPARAPAAGGSPSARPQAPGPISEELQQSDRPGEPSRAPCLPARLAPRPRPRRPFARTPARGRRPRRPRPAAREQGDPGRGAVGLLPAGPGLHRLPRRPGDDGRPPRPRPRRDRQGRHRRLPGRVDPRAVEGHQEGLRNGHDRHGDGKTITGLLAEERPDAIVLRDPARDGKLVTIASDEIEQRQAGGPSLMPAGLVNALASRQQFLDLVRYLWRSPTAAPSGPAQLRPDPAARRPAAARVRARPRPRRPDRRPRTRRASSAARRSTTASAPTATARRTSPARCRPRSGSPRARSRTAATRTAMYQTLTARLRPDDAADLDGAPAEVRRDPLHPRDLPQAAQPEPVRAGRPRLPRPACRKGRRAARSRRRSSRGSAMDYGPSLMATIEVGEDGRTSPTRGSPSGSTRGRGASRAAGLDRSSTTTRCAWPRPGAARASSTGTAINFNGRHEVHPRVVGPVQVANPIGPGWADPETGRFDDPRLEGRDGRPYGPLPRDWAPLPGPLPPRRPGDPLLHRRRGRRPRDARPRDGSRPARRPDLRADPGDRPVDRSSC